MTRKRGIVKWFNRIKGIGFIEADIVEEDIFVHYKHIEGEGYANLYEGETVSFEMVDIGKGPQARKVRRRMG